jgi:hypothetical protein
VLLAATITVFSFPGAEFGPSIVARPIWALILLHTWQIIGQGRHRAWAALSVEIGLLVLTTSAALPLLTMLAVFVLATQKGRRALASMDALYAAIVTLVLVLPYLVWLIRADMVLLPALPAWAQLQDRALGWGALLAGLLFALSGAALLLIANSRALDRKNEDPPLIFRPPVDSFARLYIYVFALVPPFVLSFIAALFDRDQVIGGDGVALLPAGLAIVIVAGDLIALRRQQFPAYRLAGRHRGAGSRHSRHRFHPAVGWQQ